MNLEDKHSTALPLLFFTLTILTRLPFTSKFLYHMDSVHFALALKKYDIAVHQPHPPGYFLYVMLGRFVNLFVKDTNSTFILIGIIFSGATVVAVYYLGKEIFDKRTGIFAAAVALTSPNLWFHGEVALSYIVEAFFSTLVAFLCWNIIKGKHHYIWISAVVLGIAGGIRQNSMVFLLPLWLFSVKEVPLKRISLSIGLLGMTCLLWFIPMVYMTGGWDVYHRAFRELWLFNTGHVSVFERGWASFKIFSSTLFDFTFYGIGTGIFILGLAVYSLIRYGNNKELDKTKVFFFSLWLFPAVLFYLLIFIHPANPGYVLIFLPALFILIAASLGRIDNDLKKVFKTDVAAAISAVVIIVNSLIFLYSRYPVSYREITTHDRYLSVMLSNIKTFDPLKTAIFIGPYIFYGYRHIMYYLPEYMVYQVDVRVAQTGEVRNIFWGVNRQTFQTDVIVLPENIKSFILPIFTSDKDKLLKWIKLTNKDLFPDFCLVTGPIKLIKEIYPELKVRFRNHY